MTAPNALRSAALLVLAVLLGGCAGDSRIPGETAPEAAAVLQSDRDGTPPFRGDIMRIPDAVPRPEVRTAAGNKSPYTVLGQTYTVRPVPAGTRERGLGSWYGTKFHGRKTSLGEDYDVYSMTAAHKTLPLPSYVRVTNLENGRRIVVRVNDRGPFHDGRVIDLSYAAAYRLGYANGGTALVELEVLDPMAPEWVAKRAGLAPEANTVAVEAAPIAAGGRRTWLQAGAFRNMDGARSLQQDLLRSLGREVSIHSGGGWHRVRVGPLQDSGALEEVRQRL
ncbi:MAG: septal ring lytic transglycosylase RlpA family protein, partial [Gammaproteobacteria bacterium]